VPVKTDMTDSVHTVAMMAIKETSSIARYSNIILANYYSTFEEHIIYNTIIYYRYEYTMVRKLGDIALSTVASSDTLS
jgi:hypothetical protein